LLQFITAIPWNVHYGTGCYVGTRTLIEALRQLGVEVSVLRPRKLGPIYAVGRIIFNESLRWRKLSGDAIVGIDVDGYAIARTGNSPPHVACIKGVLGDAVPFESGATKASLSLQARLERTHARRADLVITVSRYCAARLAELYRVENAVVVPELIDLDAWRALFRANPGEPDPSKFKVLCVCRFYPRKRIDVLLRAAALLYERIPQLEIRIVGDGPEYRKLQRIASDLKVGSVVRWAGQLSLSALAGEYGRCDIFCLPSVQEGFGIVFLEAMAAGKPIVAASAAAVPEVVRHGMLAEPDNPEALAEAILRLYRDPELRASLGRAGLDDVEQFGMHRVARQFLGEIGKIAPAIKVEKEYEFRPQPLLYRNPAERL
jgi:glycosyltransferase involved in cell wall biosynthesis